MKRRKIMALLMAGTMLVGSTMMVGASSVSTNSVSDNTVGTEIEGEGEVDYINTTVYEVIIPTSGSLGLTVDPQGLTGLEDGQSATAADLSAYAGKVFSDGVAVIANLGSEPVKVGVELELTGDATRVTTENAVNAGAANNILLYAVPAANDFYDSDYSGASYTASTTGIVMGATGSPVKAEFVIPAAEFEFKKNGTEVTYGRKAGTTPHGTGLTFAGKVNTNADWSAYEDGTKKIGMKAKFTFTHNVLASDVADSTDGAPALMKAYTDDKVTVTAGTTSGGSTSGGTQQSEGYVMTKNSNGSVSYTFVTKPSGTLTEMKVDGVVKSGPVTNGYATYSNGVFSIDAQRSNLLFTTSKTYTVVVTIGGKDYTLKYTK